MSEDQEENTCSLEVMALSQANNHLAFHLHHILAEGKGNVFFSPFSLSTAMVMLVCAAEGDTKTEMKNVLGYYEAGIDDDAIISAFEEQLSIAMKSTDSYTLMSANSMLSQIGFEVKDEYKFILSESFKALLLEVDFQSDPSGVVDQINDWVKEKTNNMIPQIIDSLDPSTVMVLLNAVYFKGSWLSKFNEALTTPQEFYNKGDVDHPKTVEMMHMKEYFPFIEKESFQALQLPYAGEEIAMLILLPRNKDGLEELESTMEPSFVQDLSKELHRIKVNVALPRFRLEYSQALVPFFQRLGIEKLFNPGAELRGASDSPDLAVSEIVHKAVLEVNEEGSEAAAATVMAIRMCAAFIEPEFVVDHPFLFVIYDLKSMLILFMGRVEEL